MIKGIIPKIRRLCFCLNKQPSSGPFLCLDLGVTMLFSGTLSPIMSVQPQRPELLSAVTSPSSASLCPWQPFRWLLQRLVPPNLSQYTFLSYVSYIHNILSCVTFMVAPLFIQQTIFHAASVLHASVFMPCNNFAHHVEVVVLSASVSVNNALPFHRCDCVQRCHAI